ncbi:MAG: type II secretion system GspH family protein [Desulfobacterales bacterium]|nr:type II secretion system GspH family protein [Desulfobacterales bacterium]
MELKKITIRKGRIQNNSSGFTLIEMLIVVIILGILAIIIIPQINVSSGEARLNTLKTNLNTVRNAIELYYHQHNNIYPGAHDDSGNPVPNTGQAQKAFLYQLTSYTDINGEVKNEKDGTYKFGPYLKSNNLPLNPFNNNNSVLCDITTTDITARASNGSSGWKFYTKTGIFLANDGAHDNL